MATKKVKFLSDGRIHERSTYSDVSDVARHEKNARVLSFLMGATYLLLSALSLLFILSRILYGGFYAGEAHDLAMWSLIAFAALLLGGAVAYFILPRVYKRVPAHLLRRLLYLGALAVAIVSMVILGTSSYLLVAIAVGVAVLSTELLRLLHLSGKLKRKRRKVAAAVLVLSLVTAVLAALATAGLTPIKGDGSFVEMSVLSRTVRYELDEEEETATLSKMMLTATDAFRIPLTDSFTVSDLLTVGDVNYFVRGVGREAFCGVRAFPTVYLPASVLFIEEDAFRASSVTEVHVAASTIHLADGLRSSSVRTLYLDYDRGLANLTVDGELSEDVTILVPRELIDEYRIANPDCAAAFAPIVEEDEVYVNFNIKAPADSGEITAYVDTVITKKDGRVALPYGELRTETDAYGPHFVYEQDGRRFRLLTLTANGEPIALADQKITAGSSLSVYGEWVEVYSAYADYTLVGGTVVELGEFPLHAATHALPTGITHDGKPGYVCHSWYDGESGTSLSAIADLNKSYTLTPEWSLIPPTVTAEGYTVTYDSQTHSIEANAAHLLDTVSFAYLWTKDGVTVSESASLPFCHVADSGNYLLTVTATDVTGATATETKTVTVGVEKAPLTVSAEDKVLTYGEGTLPLTYTVGGLLGDDTLTGELTRVAGDDAGSYAIAIGTLAASDDYTLAFVPATYTVNKARYDMSGVSLPDADLVYDRTMLHLSIVGTLPVGLDGIPVTVSYQAVTDVGTYTLDAIFATESKNYEVPARMSAKLTVTPRPITVTANPVTVTYGDPEPTLTYTADGLIAPDTLTGELTREAGTDVGTYKIEQGTLANPNYAITFIPADYTVERADSVIDVTGVKKDYVYTGEEQTVNSGATLNHAEAALVYANNTFTDVGNGGIYTIKISVPETKNYDAAEVTLDIRVEKAETVINVDGIQKTYVYNGTAQSITSGATYNHAELPLQYKDNVFTDAGIYTVTVTVPEGPNYKAATATVLITVEKARVDVPTPELTQYVYEGAPIELMRAPDKAPYTVEGATVTHPGTHLVTVTLTDTKNYEWADPDFNGKLAFTVLDPTEVTD